MKWLIPRFRLRTLFVLVAIVAFAMGCRRHLSVWIDNTPTTVSQPGLKIWIVWWWRHGYAQDQLTILDYDNSLIGDGDDRSMVYVEKGLMIFNQRLWFSRDHVANQWDKPKPEPKTLTVEN